MLGKYQILTNTLISDYFTLNISQEKSNPKIKDYLLTFIDRFYLECLHFHHETENYEEETRQNTFVITSQIDFLAMQLTQNVVCVCQACL